MLLCSGLAARRSLLFDHKLNTQLHKIVFTEGEAVVMCNVLLTTQKKYTYKLCCNYIRQAAKPVH